MVWRLEDCRYQIEGRQEMTKKAPVIVRMKHIRACLMCSGGTREFFIRHNMDWNKFLSEGLPEEEFIKTGDAMALQVVEAARHGR